MKLYVADFNAARPSGWYARSKAVISLVRAEICFFPVESHFRNWSLSTYVFVQMQPVLPTKPSRHFLSQSTLNPTVDHRFRVTVKLDDRA